MAIPAAAEQQQPPQLSDIFSLRTPRDIRAGVASALKSVSKGCFGAAVGLVAAPVVGATTDGLPGFAKGVATGGPGSRARGRLLCTSPSRSVTCVR